VVIEAAASVPSASAAAIIVVLMRIIALFRARASAAPFPTTHCGG
jgi:hypothetical protein